MPSGLRVWLERALGRRPSAATAPTIPDALWQPLLQHYPFLAELSGAEQEDLRTLCRAFLRHKEFHGAQGLVVTDAMALAVAAQACLPLLHMGQGEQALRWYRDFVGIVLHPAEVVAQRETVDATGVVHHWSERISGEAMHAGPLTLSWQDVEQAGQSAASGYNVVIHEFVHVIDMHGKPAGMADGCPLLPRGWLGHADRAAARRHWNAVLQASHQRLCDAVSAAERFGSLVAAPWLDPYAAQSVDEFFAVTAEAYFVAPGPFAQHCPELLPLYDAFFRPPR